MMKIRDIINLLEKNTEGYDEDELLTIKIAPYDLDINIFLSLQIEKGVGNPTLAKISKLFKALGKTISFITLWWGANNGQDWNA